MSIVDDRKNSTWSVGRNFGVPPETENELANSLIELSQEWTSLCIANIGVSSSLAFIGGSFLKEYIEDSLIPYLEKTSVGHEQIEDKENEKTKHSFVIDEQDAEAVLDKLDRVDGLDHASNSAAQAHLGAIISDFEFLMLRIATEFSKENPADFLDMDEKITVGELFAAGDLDAVVSARIDKKIRSEMRGSHYDIIKWINSSLNLGSFGAVERSPYFKDFMESCQRRHLFTHNGGVVNKSYLEKCDGYGLLSKDLPQEGDKLTVTRKYLRRTCGRAFLLGTFFIHMSIQKLGDKEREASLSQLLSISHDLLCTGNTKLAERVVEFVESSRIPLSTQRRLSFAINKALAKLHNPKLNEKEQHQEAKKVIDSYDWSVTTPVFDLALACIDRDFTDLIPLAKKAAAFGLEFNAARSFFVFKEARKKDGFMECFPRKPVALPR